MLNGRCNLKSEDSETVQGGCAGGQGTRVANVGICFKRWKDLLFFALIVGVCMGAGLCWSHVMVAFHIDMTGVLAAAGRVTSTYVR